MALYAINKAKIENPNEFRKRADGKDIYVETLIFVGYGYAYKGFYLREISYANVTLVPSNLRKGYKVLTSYPTVPK
ncbi:hypothetical protein IW492_11895 [Enterococcus sp. BWB1-3]|uniref:hypothetical protein n=1 Tax=Enterococcus sp. BWB1-3 TaxID=2787713 RepID=UPI0019204A1C|nr:hypothetical protein [Enterococcus sp. BWB1-3]MBL1229935.1 hypothetical protein [Enterococcus sp. BWB1-3]